MRTSALSYYAPLYIYLAYNHLTLARCARSCRWDINRYEQRAAWLLSGTNAVFGCLVEKNVVIAVDTSGSMFPHMDFLKVCA